MQKKWLIMAALFPLLSFSQEKKPGSRLNTTVSVGCVAGESAARPLFQVASGFETQNWFAGLGTGVDFYRFYSIPLFAEGKLKWGKNGYAFLYGNAGYNFPVGNPKHTDNIFKSSERYYGGFYMDAGIGYGFPLSSSQSILLSAGYSRKNIVNQLGYTYNCSDPPCPDEIFKYHYGLGRIIAKLGWQF